MGNVVQNWEKSANVFIDLDIKVVKIRIGVVLSKKGGALEKMKQPIVFGVGAPLGTGKQFTSWIHVADLVKMIMLLVTKNTEGVYNAVAPNPVTNLILTKEIAKQLNKPLLLPNIPKFLLQLALGEMHEMICDSQKVSSLKIENKGFVFQFETIEKP